MHKVHLRVYKLYSLCKHSSHSHMELYVMSCNCRRGRPKIYHNCCACRSHHRSVTLSVCCLDGSRSLVVKSCRVCVRKVAYAQIHLLTHLVIFAEILMTGSPSNSQTSTLELTRLTVTQNSAEVSNNPFQFALPTRSSTNPPIGQTKSLIGQ